jgi:hypothetical protein
VLTDSKEEISSGIAVADHISGVGLRNTYITEKETRKIEFDPIMLSPSLSKKSFRLGLFRIVLCN